jgi:hypothetical protein
MKRSPLKRKTPLRSAAAVRIGTQVAVIDDKAALVTALQKRIREIERRPRKPLPAKRATARRSSRVRDEAYLAWCRLQPCAVGAHLAKVGDAYCISWQCSGRTEPDHKREGVGAGKKASDIDAWPCCQLHHRQRHDLTGFFKSWARERLNTFIRDRIAEANAHYERHLASGDLL